MRDAVRIALWERKWGVIIFLGVLCAVHWGLLYRGMFIVHAKWEDSVHACVVNSTRPDLLKLNFFYSELSLRLWDVQLT